jgi:hypothetical protein
MDSLTTRIRHSIRVFGIFREGEFIFRYENKVLTVYKESIVPRQIIQRYLTTRKVKGVEDAEEFIESFLRKI